jgi:hypothetical protein
MPVVRNCAVNARIANTDSAALVLSSHAASFSLATAVALRSGYPRIGPGPTQLVYGNESDSDRQLTWTCDDGI